MPEAAPILELVKVSKAFAAPQGRAAEVLSEISLEVYRNESVAIVGPSGSGKSTLLHIMGGLDRPSAGRVLLEGQSLPELDEPALAAVRNQRIGFVFQAHYLLPQCTVLENVLIPTLAARRADRPMAEPAEHRARRLLDRVGLRHVADRRPAQISGGERQRAAVVRALINRPEILLADEPTGALDSRTASELARLLVELNREEGLALVTVTHSHQLADAMGRRLTLQAGRLAS